jgi:hypothetical protein
LPLPFFVGISILSISDSSSEEEPVELPFKLMLNTIVAGKIVLGL